MCTVKEFESNSFLTIRNYLQYCWLPSIIVSYCIQYFVGNVYSAFVYKLLVTKRYCLPPNFSVLGLQKVAEKIGHG